MKLLARLIGRVSPYEICDPSHNAPRAVREELERDPMSAMLVWNVAKRDAIESAAWVKYAWAGAQSLRDAPAHLRRLAFSSPAWTTVAQLRDPWARAISSFRYQIREGTTRSVQKLDPRNASDFLLYIKSRKGKIHHSGAMGLFCGFPINLRYDIVIDSGDGRLEASWGNVLDRIGINRSLLTTGWEPCVGSPGLLSADAGRQGNADKLLAAKLTAEERLRVADQDLCTAETANAVAVRYAKDYALIKQTLGVGRYTPPHKCLVRAR